MPQLDLATYPGVIASLSFLFFSFFLLLILFFLPIILAKLLAVKKILNSFNDVQHQVHNNCLLVFAQNYKISLDFYQTNLENFYLLENKLIYSNILFIEQCLNFYVFDLVEEKI